MNAKQVKNTIQRLMKAKKQNIKTDGGQAMITAVLFFLLIALSIVFGVSGVALRESKISKDLISSKQSYFLAEASGEDVVYRISNGMNYSNSETLDLNGFTATTTVFMNVDTNQQEVVSVAIFQIK